MEANDAIVSNLFLQGVLKGWPNALKIQRIADQSCSRERKSAVAAAWCAEATSRAGQVGYATRLTVAGT